MPDPAARLSEIFDSIQGEGLWIGRRQVFLRFAACNLDCPYCDTPGAREPETCRFVPSAHDAALERFPNPLSAARVLELEERLAESAGGLRSVSVTGGEPLLEAAFLESLLPALKERGREILLETNGTLPGALERVVGWVDLVSMDLKLPFGGGGVPAEGVFREFLDVARRTRVCVKAVAYPGIPDAAWDEAFSLVGAADPTLPFVIQPVTPGRRVPAALPPADLFALEERARRRLADVRVIPQAHRAMGLP